MLTHTRITALALTGVLAALAVVLMLPGESQAVGTTFNVNSPADNLTEDNLCTLREALKVARTNSVAVVNDCGATPGSSTQLDTINVPKSKFASGTYNLVAGATDDTGDLDTGGAAAGPLLIQGTGIGTAKIDANDVDRVLEIPTGGNVTIENMTLTNGTIPGGGSGGVIMVGGTLRLDGVTVSNGTAFQGGNISATDATSLTIEDSVISGGQAGSSGGGLLQGGTGSFAITRSTFSGNHAGGPGGGISASEGTVTITDSTISGNSTDDRGGGLRVGSGGDPSTTSLTNVTISGNTAASPGGGALVGPGDTLNLNFVTFGPNTSPTGQSLLVQSGTVNVGSTILTGADPCDVDGGSIVSSGNNIETANTCGLGGSSQTNTDPMLDPLAAYTGTTHTHRLKPGSPAIDNGSGVGCPATDQRGKVRPQNGDGINTATCDIGAFEVLPGTDPTQTPVAGTPINTAPATPVTPTPTLASTPSVTPQGQTPTPTPTATPGPTQTAINTPPPTGVTITPATATATPVHTPTGTPSDTLVQGDVNCDGDVDEDDMTLLLEYFAELTGGEQDAPCPDLNEPEALSGDPWGDLNCDGDIDGLDALLVLLFEADLELPDPVFGCFQVGDTIILTS